jgi:hypothetical protein
MSTSEPAAAVFDPSLKGRAGKGLGWSETDHIALAVAAVRVSSSSIRGSQMKGSELARSIRTEFLGDMAAPKAVDVRTTDGGNLDARRWDGRSLLACSQTWRKLKAECVAYHSILIRLKALKPTGHLSEEDSEGRERYAQRESSYFGSSRCY